jgi:small subunit ribosomal protein S5
MEEKVKDSWDPQTKLGRMVKEGKIKTMEEALRSGLMLREQEIVDLLLPNLEEEVINVNLVQRMTDSGRKVNFLVIAAVGNRDGFVGLGKAKTKETRLSIVKAIKDAKLNLIEVTRGCGSWECRCGAPHTFPYRVKGKSGSTEVTFKPAPWGVGLVVGKTVKPILELAGIKDVWTFTKGTTRTTVNYAQATFDALKKTSQIRVSKGQEKVLGVKRGLGE